MSMFLAGFYAAGVVFCGSFFVFFATLGGRGSDVLIALVQAVFWPFVLPYEFYSRLKRKN